MKISVFGLCRFSVLTTGGFKSGPKDDIDEKAYHLLSDRRLAERICWFEKITIPSVKNQDNERFKFLIITSDRTPSQITDRIKDAIAGVSNFYFKTVPPGKHAETCNQALYEYADEGSDVIAQFRLDDDDGVAKNYISRVHDDFRDAIKPIYNKYGMVSADYAKGFILEADSTRASLYQTTIQHLTCAQTLYIKPGLKPWLFSWGHHKLFQQMPTITFQNENMFVRGKNRSNDCSYLMPKADIRPWDLGALKRRFNISINDLQSSLYKEGL